MKNKLILTFGFITLVLSACASTTPTTTTNESFAPAVEARSTPPTKASTKPIKTYKIPFQPLKTTKTKYITGKAAIVNANRKATQSPKSSDYVNSIMTYDYMPGGLYKVYCAPLSVTDIQLQRGEQIVSVAGGDTLRWQVSKTYSGSGPNRIEHILVKPTNSGLTNTLVITTDRRTYHLLLETLTSTYMAGVQWRYPGEDTMIPDMSTIGPNAATLSSEDLNLKQLDFGYSLTIVGRSSPAPAWMPKMIFDDGHKTYIQLPDNVQELPTLFIGGLKTGQIINYRIIGNYFIVDGIFKELQLRSGQVNPQVVLIKHS